MIEERQRAEAARQCPIWRMEAPPLVQAPPSAACVACVVIPARDEAEAIEGTLAALADQQDLNGRPLDPHAYEVVLVANNCRDATASIARQFAERHPVSAIHVVELELAMSEAHVGAARRLGMDEAARRLLSVQHPCGIIATTDADTLVSPTWLAATLREARLGAEAVGGRILVTPRERQLMAPPVRRRFLRNVGYWALANEATARIDPRPGDPWPCHEQFFGASLAITARAYQAIGGLPVLPSGEDVALAAALRRADVEIRHSPDVRVHTSGRLDGRTPAGLATLLRSWASLTMDDHFPCVPSAPTVVARATCRRALRDLWTRTRASRDLCAREVACLADRAQVSEDWLRHALLDVERFGVLLEALEQRAVWDRAPDLVEVRVGIDELRCWLEPYRREAAPQPMFARHVDGLPMIAPLRASQTARGGTDVSLSSPSLEEVETVRPLAPPPQAA